MCRRATRARGDYLRFWICNQFTSSIDLIDLRLLLEDVQRDVKRAGESGPVQGGSAILEDTKSAGAIPISVTLDVSQNMPPVRPYVQSLRSHF